jgi:hypothetical protein
MMSPRLFTQSGQLHTHTHTHNDKSAGVSNNNFDLVRLLWSVTLEFKPASRSSPYLHQTLRPHSQLLHLSLTSIAKALHPVSKTLLSMQHPMLILL